MTNTQHTLVYDLSNLAYISAGLLPRGAEQHSSAPEQIFEQLVQYCRQLYRWFEPNHAIFACDTEPYWRSEIFPDYKANRTESTLKLNVRKALEIFQREKSAVCCALAGCEADDIIYAATQHVPGRISIVSADQDFVQLINERVKLYQPRKKQFAVLPKNPGLELFIKCIRGDKSDNIPSAYPRVLKKVLQRAYLDPKLLQKIMATELDNGQTVQQTYERNRQLIDLSNIPEHLYWQLCERIDALVPLAKPISNLEINRHGDA